MKRLLFWLVAAALIFLPARSIVSGQSPAPITVQHVIASGFTRPVVITHAGDGSNRLFVVEKTGKIKIVKNGAVLAQPFLDLTGQVSGGGEQGLLGLAFHPQYKTNGFFFIYYTDLQGNTVVARYKVSSVNPDAADLASKKQVLSVVQPFSNHNGGTLAFGRDGYLYIGLGDGGSGGDPNNNGQSLNTLLGKMLRVDINTSSPYLIPSSNPFVGVSGARGEIWAYGLRNPWKYSFDRETGDLYIGDVGQNQWEEIDFSAFASPSGLNFGWRCMEGTHAYSAVAPCNNPAYLANLTPPVTDYSHSVGTSVTGGFVYRGSLFPDLRGRYYYADFGTGKIWSLFRNSTQTPPFSAPVLELANTGINISGFGEDEAGEVYLADYSGGTIRRLESVNGPTPDLSGSTIAPASNTANRLETVKFTITLKNTGAAASGLSLTNSLPAGLNFAGELTATSGDPSQSSGTITWGGSVPSAGTVTIEYDVTVASGVQNGSLLN
ncbi:MAG: PQQ-dependent sugar dehydrogenase, partial [Anaerolineaceae bacterium]|nr:PQQ-dependent sugar dehydrogenase [Anaerolineaceae bacterium]